MAASGGSSLAKGEGIETSEIIDDTRKSFEDRVFPQRHLIPVVLGLQVRRARMILTRTSGMSKSSSIDDEVEFLLTQEQLRLMEIREGDSFYSCVTSCNENSFEEFDSAMSLAADHEGRSFTQEYEDITPVPSESETTPTTSFMEGTPGAKSKQMPRFPTPSPRKLEAIALVSARFNLIHPPEIKVSPPTPAKDQAEDTEHLPTIGVSSPSGVLEEISGSIENRTEVPEAAVYDKGADKELPVIEPDLTSSIATVRQNFAKSDKNQRLQVDTKTPTSRAIRPPTKSRTSKENCEGVRAPVKSDQLDASLDINVMSSRLMKNPRPKKLQEQSFKSSPIHLSKLLTPNKTKVTSKVAEFIRTGTTSTEKKTRDTPSLKTVPSASRIPRKCFIQSARVFGKQVVPENLMKSPKPLITIHKHTGSDKSQQVHINESVYETFEANVVKKC